MELEQAALVSTAATATMTESAVKLINSINSKDLVNIKIQQHVFFSSIAEGTKLTPDQCGNISLDDNLSQGNFKLIYSSRVTAAADSSGATSTTSRTQTLLGQNRAQRANVPSADGSVTASSSTPSCRLLQARAIDAVRAEMLAAEAILLSGSSTTLPPSEIVPPSELQLSGPERVFTISSHTWLLFKCTRANVGKRAVAALIAALKNLQQQILSKQLPRPN